ncbi:hypothetical protein KAX02_06795 [candidate division WOR-3 bacterium]|nr:hypothetical protein [candidate division WOR-3 bacterium]
MIGIIGIITVVMQISVPTNNYVERDQIPFAGWMPEIVVTAQRDYSEDYDSIPYIGMMPEIVVTAPRYYGEENKSVTDNDSLIITNKSANITPSSIEEGKKL